MREITWSVKDALNVPVHSFSTMSICLQRLITQSHWRPFSATYVLRVRINDYLWTSGVNLDTAVRTADPDLLLECKMFAIWWRFPLIFVFYMLNVRHIFYFRFVWPTDRESIPHASTLTSIIPTKFEVDMTIHCLVTLAFDHLTLNSWRAWRDTWVTWPTLPPSLNTLRLFVHELRVITVPIDYHSKCVRATARAPNHVTRD